MDQSSTATLIAAILASALSLLGILVSAFLSHRQRKAEDEREVRQLDFLREQATTTWLR